jgi:hypothetical protein
MGSGSRSRGGITRQSLRFRRSVSCNAPHTVVNTAGLGPRLSRSLWNLVAILGGWF